MFRNRLFSTMLCGLACVGMVVPQTAVQAATKTAKKTAVTDVTLTANGSFTGTLLNSQGKPVDGAAVTLKQGGKPVAKSVTNKKGEFTVKNVRTGVYQVDAGQGSANFRLWNAKTAPPKSLEKALLIQTDGKVVRGQFGGIDIITATLLGTSITAAVLAGINNGDINDLEDKIDRIPTSP